MNYDPNIHMEGHYLSIIIKTLQNIMDTHGDLIVLTVNTDDVTNEKYLEVATIKLIKDSTNENLNVLIS